MPEFKALTIHVHTDEEPCPAWRPTDEGVAAVTSRDEVLRGHLKAAREHLCAAQPQCVIVASRAQLQLALDRIDYVAGREGVDPGDTFTVCGGGMCSEGHTYREGCLLYEPPAEAQPFRVTTKLEDDIANGTGAVWSLSRIYQVASDAIVSGPGYGSLAKALDMLRWHVDHAEDGPGPQPSDDDVVDVVIHGEFTDAQAAMVAALTVESLRRFPGTSTTYATKVAAQTVRMARGAERPGWDEDDITAAIDMITARR